MHILWGTARAVNQCTPSIQPSDQSSHLPSPSIPHIHQSESSACWDITCPGADGVMCYTLFSFHHITSHSRGNKTNQLYNRWYWPVKGLWSGHISVCFSVCVWCSMACQFEHRMSTVVWFLSIQHTIPKCHKYSPSARCLLMQTNALLTPNRQGNKVSENSESD